MKILNGADNILQNLENNRGTLQTLTSRLASGLRIQSAVDDPSGITISETLKTKVLGLQQASENVQAGGNLLSTADAAAASIQQVLQRIRSLIVESNSDINSNEQLQSIQTEIDAMLQEINTIAGNANFNGLKLFDGSHDTTIRNTSATQNVTVVQINPGPNPDGTSPTTSNAASPDPTQNPALISSVQENPTQPFLSGLAIFQIIGYSSNPTDPATGPLGVPGVYIRQILYSASTGYNNGNGNESIFVSANPTNAGFNNSSGSTPGAIIQFPSNVNGLEFNFQNFTQADVGSAIGFEFLAPSNGVGGGTAININDTGSEGGVVSVSLPTLSTSALNIGDISILRPTQVDAYDANFANIGQTTGVDTSNQYAALDAETRVDQALQNISSVRAQLGAEVVATQGDQQNADNAAVQMQAAQSNIADLNVGSAVTDLTRAQILNQVGTSVLSQFNFDQFQLAHELIQALIA